MNVLRPVVGKAFGCCPIQVKAKFHYASWFGASSELAPN